MKVSLNWLNDYVDVKHITPETLKDRFTIQSQEVESLSVLSTAKNIVVGHTITCEPHQDADKLQVCSVDVGTETLQIICGAPNVKADQKVVVALPGAVLPGDFKIKKTKIRGVDSSGMICSLKELGIDEKYHQEAGIHVLPSDTEVGRDAKDVLGFEDMIMDVDGKPDRPDLLSMFGFAYDVKALFDLDINLPTPAFKSVEMQNPFKITINTKQCGAYYGAYIKDVVIKPSPLWMKARLIAAGIRPINNVVDITNYVMLETGQPLHAFDATRIGTTNVVVRQAHQNETFTTLDEVKRTLSDDDIVITNGEKPIALAGVMGGLDSEVESNTDAILLESAAFDPINVRRTSTRLDLKSESSTRFEKGIDKAMTEYALKRACDLLTTYAHATVSNDVAYVDNRPFDQSKISLSLTKLNSVLGSTLNLKDVKDILRRLDFDYTLTDETFTLTIPTRRPDMETYQDLIEEIGRIFDYNNLENTLPKTIAQGGLSDYQFFKRSLRRTLTGLGLNETITYSLIAKQKVYDLTIDKQANIVSLHNPLSEIHSTLILSPLNGLVEAAAYNTARRQADVHMFEVSKKYTNEGEEDRLAILMTGPYRNHYWQTTQKTNFFTLKGVIEALKEKFNTPALTYETIHIDNYHPHQTALIKAGDVEIGHIGKLHPQYADRYDLEDVFVADINLETFYALKEKEYTYEKVLKFPSMSRDIALVLDESIPAGDIISSIYEHSTAILKNAYVFDVYQGEHIETSKKSLAIRMRFEDKTGTLKTSTIDEMVKNILEALKKEHQAVLR